MRLYCLRKHKGAFHASSFDLNVAIYEKKKTLNLSSISFLLYQFTPVKHSNIHYLEDFSAFSVLYSSKSSSRRKGSKPKKKIKNGFHPTSRVHENAMVSKSIMSEQNNALIQNLISESIVNGLEVYQPTDHHLSNGHAHADSAHHGDQSLRYSTHQRKPNPMSHILSPFRPKPKLVSDTGEWKRLVKHADYIKSTHLRDLMKDTVRCNTMYATHDGVYLDYSRQRATLETMDLLLDLAERQNLKGRITDMARGEKINFTEDRAVLHHALRAKRDQIGKIIVDDVDVVEEVYQVLDQIKEFTDAVRQGLITGYTGKRLRNIISVGIGGSYLGPEFLHECLKTEPEGINSALGYTLRFLCNVDPVDVERACADLDPEETLIVIVSKTFTTAETMLNARTMRQWLWDFMGDDVEVVRKHVVAVASISSIENVKKFGIDVDTYFFRFWDWVGGRYSVCSAVGGVPISLLYGFELFEKFLQVSFRASFHVSLFHWFLSFIHSFIRFLFAPKGAHSIDEHFLNSPLKNNIPAIMGLLGVWNMSFMGYSARTILPYSEALLKLPAHIQQLDMEVSRCCCIFDVTNGDDIFSGTVPIFI